MSQNPACAVTMTCSRPDKPRTFQSEPSARGSSARSRVLLSLPTLYRNSSRKALTPKPPRALPLHRANPPTKMTTEPSAKFQQGLNISDDALKRMSPEAYRGWLKVMFQGIACLVRKRCANPGLSKRQMAQAEKWCEEWHAAVDKLALKQSRKQGASRLRTKKNFKYLAGLLSGSEDWYLVITNHRKKVQNN